MSRIYMDREGTGFEDSLKHDMAFSKDKRVFLLINDMEVRYIFGIITTISVYYKLCIPLCIPHML